MVDEIAIETFRDWSEALDFQVDMHLTLINTKDPVRRVKLEKLYRKATRVCDTLKKKLCAKVLQEQ